MQFSRGGFLTNSLVGICSSDNLICYSKSSPVLGKEETGLFVSREDVQAQELRTNVEL